MEEEKKEAGKRGGGSGLWELRRQAREIEGQR